MKFEKFHEFDKPDTFAAWMRWAFVASVVVGVVGIILCVSFERPDKGEDAQQEESQVAEPDLFKPVREAPAIFPPDSNMPRGRESLASGSIDLTTFDPKRDIVRFEDVRVWFDSDHKVKTPDTEDDHEIHRAMLVPLKRLVNLMEKCGAKLKVHDAYRPAAKNKIHLENSLHCEGRAIDLTCEGISLSELAKLCWQAGFDFVLYEVPRNSGRHLHCSVKRQPAGVNGQRSVASDQGSGIRD